MCVFSYEFLKGTGQEEDDKFPSRVSVCLFVCLSLRRELSELRDELDEEKLKRMALQVTLTRRRVPSCWLSVRLHVDAAHAAEGSGELSL